MKIKKWLIHKLGGITRDEIIIPLQFKYESKNIIICQSCIQIPNELSNNIEFITAQLALKLVDSVKEHMELIVDKDNNEYRSVLKLISK